MKLVFLPLSFLLIALSGCESTTAERGAAIANQKLENEHSPFRWKATSVNGGTVLQRVLLPLPSGPTSADAQLKVDIEKALGQAESKAGRSADIKITDIKPFEHSATLIKEIWLVGAQGRTFAYVVWLRPTPDGGTDIGLGGPSEI